MNSRFYIVLSVVRFIFFYAESIKPLDSVGFFVFLCFIFLCVEKKPR